MIAVRGTWSTSFLAPSLYQRYRQNVVFINAVNDGLTPQNDNISRVPTQVPGNPLLDPQTSENYNLGFTMRPLDTWSFDVDYWHFTFDDQISLENAVELAANINTTLDPTKVIAQSRGGHGDLQRRERRLDRGPQRHLREQCLARIRGLRLRRQQCARLRAASATCATR